MFYLFHFVCLAVNGTVIVNECEFEFVVDGVAVCSPSFINPEEISETIKLVEKESQKYYPQVKNFSRQLEKNGTVIYFINTKKTMARECSETAFDDLYVCDKVVTGQNKGGFEIVVQYRECLGISALAHELIHSVEFFYLEDEIKNIADHDTPYLFTRWGRKFDVVDQTVEWQVENRMIEEFDSCEKYRIYH